MLYTCGAKRSKLQVAIKVIQKNRLDEKTLKMVSREISIMKLLNHPNVIRLYEVIDSEIFLFLVMEYAAGGEVRLPSYPVLGTLARGSLRILTTSPSSDHFAGLEVHFFRRHDPLLTYKDLTLTTISSSFDSQLRRLWTLSSPTAS